VTTEAALMLGTLISCGTALSSRTRRNSQIFLVNLAGPGGPRILILGNGSQFYGPLRSPGNVFFCAFDLL
jgi:hypothetical protein